MPNDLFNLINKNQNNNYPPFMNMMSQFKQFKESFKGDPKKEVQKLLDSGKMTQEQFDKLREMAKQFDNFIK